jgi:hypothetical protein
MVRQLEEVLAFCEGPGFNLFLPGVRKSRPECSWVIREWELMSLCR